MNVTPVIAPDTSLLPGRGVLGLLEGARSSVLAELFYFDEDWEKDGLSGTNPYMEALLDAARRGCGVKVILDSSDYDGNMEPDNTPSCAYLNELALDEGLDLEAILIDTEMTNLNKSHNKGLIVDGEKVLVSSINWNINSITNNREVALILESPEVAAYFESIFMSDWENRPPVAVAPGDICILPGGNVTLDGSLSYDPDGDPLAYCWSHSDGPVHHDVLSERTFDTPGVHVATLVVEDGRGGSDADVVNVTVNTPPEAVICDPGTASFDAGSILLLNGSCSYDADGDDLSFEWSFGDGTGNASGERVTHVFTEPGTYEVTLEVTDGFASDSDSIRMAVVLPENRPPLVLITSPREGQVFEDGDGVLLDASDSTDPDGDPISFGWESNVSGPLGTGARLLPELGNGSHLITLSAHDGMGHAVRLTRNITVKGADGPNGSDGPDGQNGQNDDDLPSFRITIVHPEEGQDVGGEFVVEVLVEMLLNGTVERSVNVSFLGEGDTVMLRMGDGGSSPMGPKENGWEYLWDTNAVPDGWCRITASALINGSWGRDHTITVNVKNGPGWTPPEGTPIRADTDEGWPWWLPVLVLAGVMLVLVAILLRVIRRKRRREAGGNDGRLEGNDTAEDLGAVVNWESE